MDKRKHVWQEHVGEVMLSLDAATLPELFVEAGSALAELAGSDAAPAGAGPWERVQLTAPDRAALLFEWLNELIYRSEVNKRAYREFRVEKLTERALDAEVRGDLLSKLRTAVKGATMHRLIVEPSEHGWHAEVVLDV